MKATSMEYSIVENVPTPWENNFPKQFPAVVFLAVLILNVGGIFCIWPAGATVGRRRATTGSRPEVSGTTFYSQGPPDVSKL